MNSAKTDDEIYWELVESFLEKANDASEAIDLGIISAALMNAAARFNAYTVAASSIDVSEFSEDLPETTNYLTSRYRDLLKEHMEDYRANFKNYVNADQGIDGQ